MRAHAIVAIGIVTAMLSIWWLAPLTVRNAFVARLGIIRGQLWLNEGQALTQKPGASETEMQSPFRIAVTLGPANSEAWFALALATERNDWIDGRATAALKMSYYTGFNVTALVAPRLELLVRTDLVRDPELRDILTRQLRVILTRAPDLKPAITAAYASATEINRRFIESELADLDQAFLDTFRSNH